MPEGNVGIYVIVFLWIDFAGDSIFSRRFLSVPKLRWLEVLNVVREKLVEPKEPYST